MAVDKLVDSTQLDADLTSVANAIRTKGGTSSQLEFPAGFVEAIGNISGGGGTDFTAEWQRPSDWPALPNDIGTYSGLYFLFKIEPGKTIYRVRNSDSNTIEIGITDVFGTFTTLLTQSNSEIDISNLQIENYFWARGLGLRGSFAEDQNCMFEPIVESIVSNGNFTFYDPVYGTAITQKTVHFLANNWRSNYAYNFSYTQNIRCMLQCVEFYGGAWENEMTFPLNCNKIVIDDVDIKLAGAGKIYGDLYGRGNSVYASVQYGDISLNGKTALRLNMAGADTEEIQSVITKLGDLSSVKNIDNFFNSAFKLETIDLTGSKLTGVTSATNAFNGCDSLVSIDWGESDLSGITSMNAMFDGCRSIESIAIPGTDIHIGSGYTMYLAFRHCRSVKTIDLSNVDFSSTTKFGSMVDGCIALENLTFKQNAGIADNIGVSDCLLLTVNSLLSLFNALATVTEARTCTIGATNLAKLTAEQKAIATDKGWTLA